MNYKKKHLIFFVYLFFCIVIFFSTSIFAATYTSVTVFGDSNSDGGNSSTAKMSYYKLFGDPFPAVNNIPKVPYFNFRFSNGYVAIEYMAYFLGLYNSQQFFNYSVGGASTLDIPSILNFFYTNSKIAIDPTGLYVIQLGQNDLERALTTPDQASTNIKNALVDLYNHGARHFLVFDSMDLGYGPPYLNASQAKITGASNICTQYNTLLASKINSLAFSQSVILFNYGQLIRNGQLNASSLGFKSAQTPCLVDGVACSKPDDFIFWDNVHLTEKAHSAIGYQLFLKIKI